MTDALSRRIIDIVATIEQAVQATPVEAARIRNETEKASRGLQHWAERADHDLRPDLRPFSLQREYEFEYRNTLGDSADTDRGIARQADQSVRQLRQDYDALLERTTAIVRTRCAELEAWHGKGFIARLLARGSRPQPPDQSLCDDIVTLTEWAGPLVNTERAQLKERTDREGASIRERGAAEINQLMLDQTVDLDRLRQELASVVDSVGLTIRPWDDSRWSDVPASSGPGTDIRLGEYEIKAPNFAGEWDAPATISFPFATGLVIDSDTSTRRTATEIARTLCVRLLATIPPGQVRFTFIDPASLGQSVADFQHLADFDPELVGTRPVTGVREIEAHLADLSAHIETVISKYLRGQFDSIDAYNAVAGELAEPYRVLVVFDYPAGFSEAAAQQLLSLIENGPRCGLHCIVVTDESREQPRDLPLGRLRHGLQRISWAGSRVRLTLASPIGEVVHDILPDASPPITFEPDGAPASPFAGLLVSVGERCRTIGTEAVTLSRLLPTLNRMISVGRSQNVPQLHAGAKALSTESDTWWTGSTADSTVAPLGKSGAQDVASLYFSSTEIAGGAIMVGLPRSGKTTSLHSAILSMCICYSPTELELFLIDAKHGVEFKIYESLPHARMVSIHSEREFCVAVLRSIDEEIARRAELMKSRTAGRANISEYRTATGETMSRIVLIMDEFHEIFEEDDQLGHAAFQAFSNIVRQGPFAGVHVVASSQTLSSMPALDRPTLQLLPQRVAFMCNETDADLVMGDMNRGTRLLTKQGQGLFNPARGEPSQNKPFQGLFIPPVERDQLLTKIYELAFQHGWNRKPRVFDGDAAAARLITERAESLSDRPVIPLGEPFTLQPSVSVTLRRSRGSNMALIGDMDDDSITDLSVRGAVHSCIAAGRQSGAQVHVVDFIGDELAGTAATVADVTKAYGAGYYRGRDLFGIIGEVSDTVEKRLDNSEYSAQTHILVLFGLQRALSLRPADPYEDGLDAQCAMRLARVLRDGPEVGVHVVMECDSAGTLQRRIGTDLDGELALRVGGAWASPADLQFVTGAYGAQPEIRRHQLLLGDQQRGSETRMRAYPPISPEELAAIRGVHT
jgi:hypothetical protein